MLIKTFVVSGFCLAISVAAATGQQTDAPASPTDQERYVLQERDGGFVRLDKKTGQMSFCTVVNTNMVCRLGAEERQAYEDELSGLSSRIETLEKQVATLSKKDPSSGRPKADVPGVTPEESEMDKEFDKAMDFAQEAMRRFFDVIKELREKYEDDRI